MSFFTTAAGRLLTTFFISMIPVIELRGAIPVAIAQGVEPWLAFAVSVLGNMLPIPFILLFIRKILQWMKQFEKLEKIAVKLEQRAASRSDSVKRYQFIGLCIFVAIPLPGTGAWTGALIAALMEMRLRRAIPAIFLGVIVAGIIITLASALSIEALSWVLG